MKLKVIKKSFRMKVGDEHTINSQAIVDALVEKGVVEVVKDGDTAMPYQAGKDVNMTEKEVEKENEKINSYSVAETKPEPKSKVK